MYKKRLLGRKAKLAGAAVLLAVGGFAMWPAAAFAASPNGQTVTETDNVHGTFYEPEATNPCNGDTFNGGQGAPFTETGKVVATDDGTGVTYSGHATAWGNFNLNERNQNSEFTLTIHLSGSDGSSITAHETTVFVMNGIGDITVDFDKL